MAIPSSLCQQLYNTAIRRESVFVLRFPFCCHVQILLEISPVFCLKYPYCCFSSHFGFFGVFFVVLFVLMLSVLLLYSRERQQRWGAKNIICFFSDPFVTRNIRMDRVRKNRRGPTCTYTLVRRSDYSMKSLCLSDSFSWVEIFPGLYNYPDTH